MANEEEYHLPGDATEPGYQPEPEKPTAGASVKKFNIDYKKIGIVIVIIIAIWGAHHLYVVVKSKSKAKQPNITNLSPPNMQLQSHSFNEVSPANQVTLAKPVTTTTTITTPAGGAGLDNRLANIEEGNAEAQAKIERTTASLAELQNTLATMASQISALNNTVQDLTGQITQQQVQIQGLAATNIQKRRGRGVGGPPPQVRVREYYIQAVIPGRAWLATNEGHTITVSSGDTIPGYGVVNGINPNPGVVSTSSGKDIVFKGDNN